MAYETLRLELEGALAVLTIDRPKALNALNSRALQDLEQALGEIAAKAELRVLILTGAGEKAFVAGADIAEMASISPIAAQGFSAQGQRAFARLETLPLATIAAVNGYALGGGCELALSCDLLYASEKAKLGLPEVGLGVIPGFGGTQRLARRVGAMRAKERIFTGETIDAARAKAIGLALEVLPPEKLLSHCREVAQKIATKGPLAIAQAKRSIQSGSAELESQAFGLLFGTDDQKEGMKAFVEKRKPNYQGK